MVKARCLKCKKEIEIKNPTEVKMKNGIKAIKGFCPKCNTQVFRIVGRK
jgi:Zn finger protein HypA/HybF involved in hydrogenase expression